MMDRLSKHTLKVILFITGTFFVLYLAVFALVVFTGQFLQNNLDLFLNEDFNGVVFTRNENWYVYSYKQEGRDYELSHGIIYDPRSFFRQQKQELRHYRLNTKYIQYRNSVSGRFMEVFVPGKEAIEALNDSMTEEGSMSPKHINAENRLPNCLDRFSGFKYVSSNGNVILLYLSDYSVVVSVDNAKDVCDFSLQGK